MTNEHDLGDEFVQRRAVRVGAAAQAAARGESATPELETPKGSGSDASLSDRVRSGVEADPTRGLSSPEDVAAATPMGRQRFDTPATQGPVRVNTNLDAMPEGPRAENTRGGGSPMLLGDDVSVSDAVRSGYRSVPLPFDMEQTRKRNFQRAASGQGGLATMVLDALGIPKPSPKKMAVLDAAIEAIDFSSSAGEAITTDLIARGVDHDTAELIGAGSSVLASLAYGGKGKLSPQGLRAARKLAQKAAGLDLDKFARDIVDLTEKHGGATYNLAQGKNLAGEKAFAVAIAQDRAKIFGKDEALTSSLTDRLAKGAIFDGELATRLENDALEKAENIKALIGKRIGKGGEVKQIPMPTAEEIESLRKTSPILNDLGALGAAIIWRGGDLKSSPMRNARQVFEDEMMSLFGDSIQPLLDQVWNEKIPLAIKKLVDTLGSGKSLPNTFELMNLFNEGKSGLSWYSRSREELERIFGNKWELVADLIAATSPNNAVIPNVKKALNILTDFVIGGVNRALGNLDPKDIHRKFVEQALTGQAITGPKIGPFAAAIKGDPNAVVLDIWMMRVFGFAGDSPSDVQRIYMTKIILDESTRLGVEPRQYQAALWVAKKIRDEGKDTFIADLDDVVKRVLKERPQLLERFGLTVSDLGDSATTAVTALVTARIALEAANGGDAETEINNTLMAAGIAGGLTPKATKQLAAMINKMRGHLTKLVRPVQIKAGTKAELDALLRDGESAIQAGDKVLQINWATIRDPQQVDDLVESVIESRKLGSGNKTKATISELRDLARNLNMDPVVFLARNPEYGNLRSDEVLAVTDVIVKSRNRLRSLAADHLADPTNEMLADAFAQQYGIHAALIQRFEDSASDIGRAMRMLQEATGRIGGDVRTVANIEDLRSKGMLSAPARQKDALQKLDTMVTDAVMGDIRPMSGAERPPIRTGKDAMGRLQGLADEAQDPVEWSKRFDKPGGPSEQSKLVQKAIDTKTVAQMVLAAQDPEVVVKGFTRKGFEAITEVWINALLSNVQGHAANILSNSLVAAIAPFERGLAGVGAYMRGAGAASDRVFAGEAAAMYVGMIHGFIDAVTSSVKTMQTGVSSFATKEVRTGAVQELLGSAHNTLLGRSTEYLATLPSRAMLAEDEYFEVINERAELWAQAYRHAMRSGARDVKSVKAAVEGFLASPPATVKEAARAFAETQTFSQDLPESLRGLQHFASQPAVKYIMPFFKTPTNIFLYNLERFPILNLAVKDMRENILKPTAAGDLARAKMAMGAMAVATAWYLAQSGIITGRGPIDPDLNRDWKAEGNLPYSRIYEDGTAKGFNRLDPYGALFGIVADFQQVSGELEADELDEVALALTVAFSNNFLSKTYVQGLSEALETVTINRPGEKHSNFWRKLGGSAVPAGVAGAERVVDPAMSDVQSLRDEIYSRIPGWSKEVPARRYINGEKRTVPAMWGPDFLSPIPTSKKANDPRWREILDQKISLSMPLRAVGGPPPSQVGPEKARAGVKLDPWQYDRLVQLAGNEFKLPVGVVQQVASAWGVKDVPTESQGMWDMMGLLVTSPVYQQLKATASGPESEAARQIRRLVNLYQNLAENYVIHGPHTPEDAELFKDVKAKWTEKQLDRIEVRSGRSARVTAEGVVNELLKGINR